VLLADAIFPAIDFSWHPQDVAHVIGTCVPALSSYFGHRMYTFQKA
jgi:putative flippase GtrA